MNDHGGPPLPEIFGSLSGFGHFEEGPRPSRRRPRREETATYRVRVEISGTKPPVWRRLELDSDLFLNEVHTILQAAFGWQDYHLHGFASGGSYYSREAELYLCPFEAQEGRPGLPEEQVRLDEVLAEKGDRLSYLYDFGDDWEHMLTLQAVLPRKEGAPRAICTAGKRAAPPEDSGGAPGYELVSAATDPKHPQHAQARAEYREVFGQDPDPDRAPLPFDIEAVNRALALVTGPLPDGLPPQIVQLLESVLIPGLRLRLLALVAEARAPQAGASDETAVRAAVAPYTWLLDHVGDQGLKLTAAGYLPPATVREAADVLGMTGRDAGRAVREADTLPVADLRESAQKMGLLRKERGRLLVTRAGRRLSTQPLALWEHLATRMPPEPNDRAERQACLLAVLVAAAGVRDAVDEVADLMTGLGWGIDGGLPVNAWAAAHAMRQAQAVLDTLGGWAPDGQGATTPLVRAFAREALRNPG